MAFRMPQAAVVILFAVLALPVAAQARSGQDRHHATSGVASWYGKEHQGKPTASGEAFDRNELTAAHRSLPLGTLLRVTNPSNGREVVVRVNDRGPFVRGRVLDLSEKAARALGMLDRGKARVEIEVADASPAGDSETAPH